jgi:hypothetical protein
MSETEFTPGPWRADWDDSGQWYIEPLGISGTALRGDSGNCVESRNAKLIAAAPDLYDALVAMTVTFASSDYMEESRQKARAAIAKARGEA